MRPEDRIKPSPPDAAMPPATFRAFMRHQASTVAVITACDTTPVGFTATSFMSVSLQPALVALCVNQASSVLPVLAVGRHIGVHFLSLDQEGVARAFANNRANRFTSHRTWRVGPHAVPLLEGVIAWAVCEVVNMVTAGDHEIVIAAPLFASHTSETSRPLLHHMGGYTSLR